MTIIKNTISLILLVVFFVQTTDLNSQHSDSQIKEFQREALGLARTHLDSALLIMAQLKRFSSKNTWLNAQNLSIEARIYMLNDKDALAYQKYVNATDQFKLIKEDTFDLFNIYLNYRNLSIIANRNDFYEESLSHYDSAYATLLQLVKIKPDIRDQIKVDRELENIPYFKSLALKRAGQLKAAVENLQQVVQRNPNQRARVYTQLGLIYKDLGQYDQAIAYYQKTLETPSSSQFYHLLAMQNLGYVYFLKQNPGEAQRLLAQAVDMTSQLALTTGKGAHYRQLFICLLDLGETYYAQGDYKAALAHWHSALKAYEDIAQSPELFVVYQWLAKGYLHTQPDSAEYYANLYATYSNNALSNRKSLAGTLEASLFEAEVSKLMEKERHTLEVDQIATRYYQWLYWTLAVAFTLLALLYWYFKFYRPRLLFDKAANIANQRSFPTSELLD